MKIHMKLKHGVSFEDAMQVLVEIHEREQRIKKDTHTNKHYELVKGKMWKKGDATGKYWELFCNSRIGYKDAKEIMRYF